MIIKNLSILEYKIIWYKFFLEYFEEVVRYFKLQVLSFCDHLFTSLIDLLLLSSRYILEVTLPILILTT